MATDPSAPNPPTNPIPELEVARPPSVGGISSRMTDIASDDEGSRSVPRTLSQRRGLQPTRSSLTPSSHSTGRPTSAGSRVSRISKTHVPSLTPQAFFRPMSSQRLQAYRGGRPTTKGTTAPGDDGDDDSSQKRASMVSESTIRRGISPSREGDVPPSRGTEFTDPIIPDRNTSNASPTGNTTIQSLGESVRLLHGREKKRAPTHLNLTNPYKPGSTQDPPQKSPLSFRSGLLSLQNKNDNDQGHHHEGGRHERLSSAATSPRTMKEPPVRPANPDQNYEYFTGNTVFWGKGRFQNARERPINIITGILVVLPSGLFFAYSYVG